MTRDHGHRWDGLPIQVEKGRGNDWTLLRPVTYRSPDHALVVKVEAGFRFDFASVPSILWWAYPPFGRRSNEYENASLIHDWLYERRRAWLGNRMVTVSRDVADSLFHEAMLHDGVRRSMAWVFMRAVRNAGGLVWRRDAGRRTREAWLTKLELEDMER